MDSIRNRAADQFPMVLLTLVSIVQALALEFLWDHLRHRPELYEYSWIAFLGWLQIAASLMGIILIWLTYSGMVMRFRWTPVTSDSVLPFLLGLIEFLMIDMMGPDNIGRWLIVLAVIFLTMIIVSHRIFKRARLDPTNKHFFANVAPATFRDFVPKSIVFTSMALYGVWLWQSGGQGASALIALIAAHAVLGYETYDAAKFWNKSMAGEYPDATAGVKDE